MSTQPPSRTRFYLDKRNGKFMGVCSGIADYTGLDVTLVRIMFVSAVFMSGGGVLPLYFIAGFMADDKPRELVIEDREEQRFWQGVRASPRRTARDIRSRLREIDRRLSYLSKVMKSAKVVDPARQEQRDTVRFGATIELADENDERRIITLVGEDEADASSGQISWAAPIARALIGARVGDERIVRLPAGEKSYEIIAIRYPD